MELKTPKRKKHAAAGEKKFSFPLEKDKKFVGVFNGQHVTISDWDSMNSIYYGGCFGKGSLSKGAPIYHLKKDDIPRIVLEQQLQNQLKWNPEASCSFSKNQYTSTKNCLELSWKSIDNFLQSTFEDNSEESWKSWKEKHKEETTNINRNVDVSCKNNLFLTESETAENTDVDVCFSKLVNDMLQSKQGKQLKISEPKAEEVIVVKVDTDTNKTDISLNNVNARLEKLPLAIEETLNLTLEEAFFLKFAVGCLTIVDLNSSELSTTDLWAKFNAVERNFLERYAIYHYYRTKGWVVRSGLKFGGDFLLYKDGPTHYHASYLVKVLDRREKLSWRSFIAINRLVETFNKDLILCSVVPNRTLSNEEAVFPDILNNYSIQEVLARRWFPSRARFSKEDSP